MTRFVMDGSNLPEFRALDAFTRGYIEALFFTDCEMGTVHGEASDGRQWNPESDSSLPGDVGFADLAAETLARIVANCANFQSANRDSLEAAYARVVDGTSYTPERAGHDFWLTRNGHGAGFWDRNGLGELGEQLTEACKLYGATDSYLGDDGKVYLS